MSSTEISIIRYTTQTVKREKDWVACEEPLEIRIEGQPVAVVMRTPHRKQDIEHVLGFLCTEGVISDRDDIFAINHIVEPNAPRYNTIDVVLASGVPIKIRSRANREFFASSSCGICGKQTQERILQHFPPLKERFSFSHHIISSLPRRLEQSQKIFGQTGGLHAAALCTLQADILVVREDVGRHNAVDKVIGWALEQDVDCSELILLVSGRVAFEIAQKALAVQIPVIAAIGAPSSMAVEFCSKANIRLFAFVRDSRYNEYL